MNTKHKQIIDAARQTKKYHEAKSFRVVEATLWQSGEFRPSRAELWVAFKDYTTDLVFSETLEGLLIQLQELDHAS